MSGTKTGNFNVRISATDNATPALDRLGKRLEVLGAPAKRFSQQVSKLGDVTGVTRLSQGMQGLASRSLDTFRSMDRIVPALGAITGAASLAGMATMVQRFGQLGQQVQNTSLALGVPVNKLTSLQAAARLAGASSEDLTAGLGSLDDKLRGATFRGDATAIQSFNALGVSFGKVGEKARTADDAFGDVAEGIKRIYDSGNRGGALRVAQNLGIENLLPLLLKGRKGIADLESDARKLGVVITPEMADRADKLATSFARIADATEGLGNAIVNRLAGPATDLNNTLADWIANNRDLVAIDVAGWVRDFGSALSSIDKAKMGAFLGAAIGYRLGGLPGALLGASAGYTYEKAEEPTEGVDPRTGQAPWQQSPGSQPFSYWNPGSWFHHSSGAGPNDAVPPAVIKRPVMGSLAYGEMQASHDFWRGKGYTEAQTAGWLSQESGESGFNAKAWNPEHTSYGLFQMTGDRLKKMQDRYHTAEPSASQQREYAYWELTQGEEQATNRAMLATNNDYDSGRVATGFERPAGLHQRERERALGAHEFNGQVAVTVDLKNAPPGTTAKATSSGVANVSPPRVMTAVQGY